jgi:predicted permease
VDRLSNIPGVEVAGATSSLPLADGIGADQAKFLVGGQSVARGEEPSAHITVLTPGAFSVLRMQLRRGRLLAATDDSGSVPVVVISESMAQRFFANEDPIGRHVNFGFYGKPATWQIVGIVADIRQTALDQPAEPTMYIPHAQAPTGGITVLLRTRTDPRAFEREVKRAVTALNPAVPVAGTATLDDVVADSLRARRFALALFSCFAIAGLLLAIIGVYGVVSHSTAERSREFGVRLALGAQHGDIVRMVVRQGVVAASLGLAIGTVAAAGLTTLLRSMLFGVTPFDPVTFAGVGLLMLVTVVVAAYIPARRATTVQPVSALRLS